MRIFNLQTRCVVDQFFKANVNFCIALNLETGRIVNQLFKANQPNLVLIIIAKCQKVKTLSFLNYLFNGIFLPTRNRISNCRNLQLIYKSKGMVLSSKKLGIRNNRVGITGVRLCLWQSFLTVKLNDLMLKRNQIYCTKCYLNQKVARRYNGSVNVSHHCIFQRDQLISLRSFIHFKDYRSAGCSSDKLSRIFPTFHSKNKSLTEPDNSSWEHIYLFQLKKYKNTHSLSLND